MPFSPALTRSIKDLEPIHEVLLAVVEHGGCDGYAVDEAETRSRLVDIAKGLLAAQKLPLVTYEAIVDVAHLKYTEERSETELLLSISHTLKLAQRAAMRDENLENIRVLRAQVDQDLAVHEGAVPVQ